MVYISITELRTYYLYSLKPNLTEYLLMYGNDKGIELYKESIKTPINPTLTGFIKYVRKSIEKYPTKDRIILFKNTTI